MLRSGTCQYRWATAFATCCLIMPGASQAQSQVQSRARRLDMAAMPLADALGDVAREMGVSFLFDRRLVGTQRAPPLHASLTAQQAFDRLLDHTRLKAKRLPSGSFVLVQLPPLAPAAPQMPPPPPENAAVPDILVTGRRTLNTDVQRRVDDIQPYRVLTSRDIAEAQSGSVDAFLRTGLPANQVGAAFAQMPVPAAGMVVSQVNLRGFGTTETLVLVDGRRMPSFPASVSFDQSDVNAIPLAAIERVETFGGTAGALYGPGAVGGTVNIVLKQALPKFWVQSQGGIDQRGDGKQWRIDGGVTLSGFDGSTEMSVIASYGHDDGLHFGDRAFVQEAARLRATRRDEPDLVFGNNVNIVSVDGTPLVLAGPAGGRALGSKITNMPANAGGPNGDATALLAAGAGAFDYSLGKDGKGAAQSLLAQTDMKSVLATVRQRIGAHLQLFANLVYLENNGAATGPGINQLFFYDRREAGNPFANAIQVAIPAPGKSFEYFTRFKNYRVSAGMILDLPQGWKFEADASLGQSGADQALPQFGFLDQPDVFTPGTGLADYLAKTKVQGFVVHSVNTMHDYSARLAGSPLRLPAGPATVTVSVEHREEAVPNYSTELLTEHRITVDSVTGEARLPILGTTTPIVPLRGMEFQLAGRLDRSATITPAYYGTSQIENVDLPPPGLASIRQSTFAFTVGAKVEPVDGLTLRASFATGFVPPTPGQFISTLELNAGQIVEDPARPDLDPANDNTQVRILTNGSPKLRPELARTLAIGAIVRPALIPGLRLSIDYLRITKSREIVSLYSAYAFHFAEFSAAFPDRITRAPLTQQDIARGFTAGFITQIDASSINLGSSTLQSVDIDLDYARTLPLGRIRLHGTATWTPSYRRRDNLLDDAPVEYADKVDGPLSWRAIGGVEWQRGGWSVGMDAQYFAGYQISAGSFEGDVQAFNVLRIAQQGARRVAAQAYFDLGIGYRAPLAHAHCMEYRVGIKNLFDHTPPLIVPALTYLGRSDYGVGYSTYGDPRGRRIVLTAAYAF